MAYTPSFGAEGWQPEQPALISRGEFKLWYDDHAYLGWPLGLDMADHSSDSTWGNCGDTAPIDNFDGNKVWIEPYDDATGVEICVGISITNKLEFGNVNQERAGMGGYRRDMRVIQFGLVPMQNVSGATVNFGDEIAACYNSSAGAYGFQKWSVGMAKIGKCWQYEIPDGKRGMVFVDLTKDALIYIEESAVVVGTDTCTLAHPPVIMDYAEATAGSVTGPTLIGYSNSTPTTHTCYVIKSTGVVLFNDGTDDVTEANFGYWYQSGT